MSRRKVLAVLVGAATSAVVGARTAASAEVPTSPAPNQMPTSLTHTAIESGLLELGALIFAELSESPYERYEVEVAPVHLAVIVGPPIEELVFRAFPFHVLSETWVMGLLSSAGFMVAHEGGRIGMFLAGVYYWYLVKERGLPHSIIGHATQNGTVLVFYYLLEHFGMGPPLRRL